MRDLNNQIIIIPARMSASRLPGKPLADIGGKPMIQHVFERALLADLAPVIVATDHRDIADVITGLGGQAVMTDASLPSGSDRCADALRQIDPSGQYRQIINLQGDLPELPISCLTALSDLCQADLHPLNTLVCPATPEEASQPQLVKVVASFETADPITEKTIGEAHYFSREAIPHGASQFWHHIGLYGWRRDALEAFVARDPSPLEQIEKLEQLRAIEAGWTIGVRAVEHGAPGVDVEADLQAARARITSDDRLKNGLNKQAKGE